eukprot:14353278-Alexandrium_andersonii.AAC.1
MEGPGRAPRRCLDASAASDLGDSVRDLERAALGAGLKDELRRPPSLLQALRCRRLRKQARAR